MHFDGIGRITEHIKIAKFEQKWRQSNDRVSAFLNLDKDWIKSKKIEEIKNKMKAGKRLSHDEKEFLRIHAPDLYEKAMKIEKERDEFRRALAKCKTKEEAMRLKTSKSLELKTEAQAMSVKSKDGQELGDLEFITMRMVAIFDEFADFAKSEEYASIPYEYEKDDKENEDAENNVKSKKNRFKKAKLTLNGEMVLNSYRRWGQSPTMPDKIKITSSNSPVLPAACRSL